MLKVDVMKTTAISLHRKKVKQLCVKQKMRDGCPKCKMKFRKKPLSIVFKDVVECSNCGYIWVFEDSESAMAYS